MVYDFNLHYILLILDQIIFYFVLNTLYIYIYICIYNCLFYFLNLQICELYL